MVTTDEPAAFTGNPGPQNYMAGPIWMPLSREISSRKDADAPGADRGRQMHGTGVIPYVKTAKRQGRGRLSNS